MAEPQNFDIAILGGGPGGYVAALRASQLGARVALVEKDRLGGTCLNRGCIPTKALVRGMEIVLEVQHAGEFGIDVGQPEIDFHRLTTRMRRVVDSLVGGVEQLLKAGKVTVFTGSGRIISPGRVLVEPEREINAKSIVIATGSVPARIPIPGASIPGVVTTDELLQIESPPKSLVIIGGGVIGVEFACIFAVLGTKITIVEMLPTILLQVEDDVVRRLVPLLKARGVEINVGASVKEIRQSNELLEVVFDTSQGQRSVQGEMVLLAVGRWPYVDGLGLSELNIKMNRRAIATNERMETNVEGIYAIGDVTGQRMLAHVASYQGEVAVENALGHRREADLSAVPDCIFSIPEIAQVGLGEKEAKEKGISYKVSRFPFSSSARAQIQGESSGFVKLVCEAESGRVLGVHIIGHRATDLIAEGTLAVKLGARARDIVETIHAHPTFPEAFHEAAMGQFEGPIHFQRL